MSLDGFIADPDGGVDWLSIGTDPDAQDDGWFGAFMDRIDALVMGRASFEKVVSFGVWPYPKPVFVRSRTMNAVPGGYDEVFKIAKKRNPEQALPHQDLFLAADSDQFGPELKEAFQPIIRDQLIPGEERLDRT